MKVLLLILASTVVSSLDLDDVDFDDEDQKEPPIVKIKDGVIRGGWEESTNGRQFALFERIPYAKPPVGNLRFKAPLPAEPWSGIFNATGPQENCLQYEPFFESVSGSEDCLLINVYTPRAEGSANLPVMVFIHGGAFFYGAGFYYDPVRIMDWDMVVVTFNYRLGPLGFLSTGDEVIPGNAGLKDQALALRWVQKNIRAFGGDPARVTLSGHSAGAASVHYHYLSPESKGTFARGIVFSGSAFAPWAFATKPAEKAKQLAAVLDCSTASSQELADCLMEKPAVEIVNATTWMYGKQFWFSPFVPTAEPEGMAGAFITKHPYKSTNSGEMYGAPLLATITADEGLYPAAALHAKPAIYLPELESDWEEKAPKLFQYEDTLPEVQWKTVAAKIKQQYLEGKPVSEETFAQLVQAVGDRVHTSGVGKLVQLHAATTEQPVYMYKYNFSGETRFHMSMTWDSKKNLGVGHGDDLFHIFYLALITPAIEKPEERQMNDLLIELLYNYCKTGIPKLPDGALKWLPLIPSQPALSYLEINSPTNLMMRSDDDFGHRTFWDSLGFNEDQHYQEKTKEEIVEEKEEI